jgi:hypothetical protein
MALRLMTVTFDAHDPARQARFWAGVLGREVAGETLPGTDTQLGLRFVAVSTRKTGLNRMHLHLTSTDLADQQRTVAAAVALGARHIDVGQRPEEFQ